MTSLESLPTRSRKRAVWAVLAGLAALLATVPLFRSGYVNVPVIDVDEAIYTVCADAVAEGQRLYVDVWDHKPPLLYHLIRGVLDLDRSAAALHWAGILLALANTGLVFLLARRLHSTLAGVVAAWLFTVYTSAYWANAFQTELILIFLQLSGILLLLARPDPERSRLRLAFFGLLFGAAYMVKYVVLFTFLPLLALLALRAWRNDRLRGAFRSVLASGLGFAFVPVVMLSAMLLDGTLGAWYEATVTYNSLYVSHDAWNLFWKHGRFFLRDFALEQWPLLLLGTAGALRAAWGLRRQATGVGAVPVLLLWLLASALAALSPLKFLPHYNYLFIPALCCLAASLLPLPANGFNADRPTVGGPPPPGAPPGWRNRQSLFRIALLGMILLLSAPRAVENVRSNFRLQDEAPRGPVGSSDYNAALLGRYIRQHTAPSERIYLWRTYFLDTYFYARRLPACRVFVWFYWLRDYLPPGGVQVFLDDFRRHPPAYVVVGNSDILADRPFPPMDRILREEYAEETLPESLRQRLSPEGGGPVRLFRRLGAQASPRPSAPERPPALR